MNISKDFFRLPSLPISFYLRSPICLITFKYGEAQLPINQKEQGFGVIQIGQNNRRPKNQENLIMNLEHQSDSDDSPSPKNMSQRKLMMV